MAAVCLWLFVFLWGVFSFSFICCFMKNKYELCQSLNLANCVTLQKVTRPLPTSLLWETSDNTSQTSYPTAFVIFPKEKVLTAHPTQQQSHVGISKPIHPGHKNSQWQCPFHPARLLPRRRCLPFATATRHPPVNSNVGELASSRVPILKLGHHANGCVYFSISVSDSETGACTAFEHGAEGFS